MKTLLIATTAFLSVPALAQTQPTTPSGPSSTTTQSQTQAPMADPMTSSTTAQSGTSSSTATTPSDPKALIASEFPTYDKDANGSLSKTEFATWIGALKAKTDATPTPAAEMTKYTDGAFATADTDKSKSVTLAELQTYLTAGA